jgi:hypothetical protein
MTMPARKMGQLPHAPVTRRTPSSEAMRAAALPAEIYELPVEID